MKLARPIGPDVKHLSSIVHYDTYPPLAPTEAWFTPAGSGAGPGSRTRFGSW